MKVRDVTTAAMLVAGLALVSGCGSSDSSTPSDSTVSVNPVGAGGGNATSTTAADGTSDESDCETPDGNTIPDGNWRGPVVFGATGVASGASGSVTSTGEGNISLELTDGNVTGISGAFQASSSGTIEMNGATATIEGHGQMLDGVLSGTASSVHMEGTVELTGTMHVTVSGASVDTPLNGSYPMATDLTIVSVSCDEVVATFIPALNAATGGRAEYFGEASWTGRRS
jgi:hypothetical protein